MKIYNLGSMNVDYVYKVDHFVSAGETISCGEMNTFPGGKGLNQSVALSRAGAVVIHGALCGSGAEFLVETMRTSGVDTSRIRRVTGAPGHAIIQVDRRGENCIMIYGGTNREITEEYLEFFLSDAKEGDFLLVQNETNMISRAIELAHERGMRVALNPSPIDGEAATLPIDKVDYFFCNEIEGAALFSGTTPDEICGNFEKNHSGALILTLGEEGSVFCKNGERVKQRAYKCETVDTTAAGDTFTGYFLAGITKGDDVAAAMDRASKASSVTVSRLGASASIPYLSEIE